MRLTVLKVLAGATVFLSMAGRAAEMPMMDHGRMMMDMRGHMVMGQNTDQLPDGCREVSENVKLTVHAGHRYAKSYPGTIFGYSEHEWKVEPCARVTVNLVNDDNVRHQWMLHGLPEDLYPMGMFHIEVTGPGEVTGTFIAPPENKTYLVHCDIAQHTEKGMKAQLIVGKGSGILPGIPGVTDDLVTASGHAGLSAAPETGIGSSLFSGMVVLGFVAGILGAPYLFRWAGMRFFGMSGKDFNSYLFNRMTDLFCLFVRLLGSLWRRLAWTRRPV
ncbi:MAG: cupredoxin domain-containing protein [Methylohalobius sp. ZOD2]